MTAAVPTHRPLWVERPNTVASVAPAPSPLFRFSLRLSLTLPFVALVLDQGGRLQLVCQGYLPIAALRERLAVAATPAG